MAPVKPLLSPVPTQAQPRSTPRGWPATGSLAPPAERINYGKSARTRVPREDHAALEVSAGRPDPMGLLERQDVTRVPDLVPVRYGRMAASPFAYFRGAALPMASDLAATPVTGLTVQACGDAHLSNFGIFASPERRLIFDINDFDETLPGPWEWDVKRLAASIEIAGRENGFSAKERRKVVLAAIGRYRDAMRAFAGMTNLDVWYAHLDLEDLRAQLKSALTGRLRKEVDKGMARARSRDSLQALAKLTAVADGQRKIVPDPPLVIPVGNLMADQEDATGLHAMVSDMLGAYRHTLHEDSAELLLRYELADLARKVVGVGSVGTRCWIVLMLGSDDADPLFLQVKEAEQSVLAEFAGPSQYSQHGERVVVGQRFTQAASDIFLGWVRVGRGIDGRPHDYYVRQLRDGKLSADVAAMPPAWMRRYASFCGWTLARAHARTGDRFAISAYLGSADVFEQAIADFAGSYADQNERDHASLVHAVKSGRLAAATGV
jgi:uncharacterized protein (DUF2252 family)